MGINQMLMKLAEGMATSCWIFGITLLFSLPLGMVIAFGRMSKKRIVQGITKIYISIMRGTPLMLQLMVVYFGRNQNFTVLPKHCGGDRFCA